MEDLKCEVIKEIEKDRIYCAYCDRHYAVYKLKHRCHPLAKCNAKKISHEEVYLEKTSELVYDSRETAIICDRCEKRKKKQESAKKSMCPGCEYVGYYVSGADKLCPSCVAGQLPAVPTVNVTHAQELSATQVISLIPMTLFTQVYFTGTSPINGKCSGWSVFAATEESLMTRDWFVETITLDFDDPSCINPTINDKMTLFSDWLRELSKKYIFHWNETSGLGWQWIKYLYKLHTNDTRYPLC